MAVVGLNPEWRCNAVPPSMRLPFGKRLVKSFEQCAWAEKVKPEDSYFQNLRKNLYNVVRLEPLENKKGLELLCSQMHNLGAIYFNPFAATEYIKNLSYFC